MAFFTISVSAIETADLVEILPMYFSVNKETLFNFLYNDNVLEIEFSQPTINMPSYIYFRLVKVLGVAYFRKIRLGGVACLEQIELTDFCHILDTNAFKFVSMKSNTGALCLMSKAA